MTVAPVATTGTSLTSTGATRMPTQQFNSELFLQLLVTQLRNQDPSSPMDSTQMINQTSQLASMEQLTALTKTTTNGYELQLRSAAANILGRQVAWTDSTGTARSGVASGVTFATDGPVITVDGERVPLADLSGVTTG